ncbi:MAG: 1-acyl-sn-glycerol-3-phosphate acyltransferase [Desulfobacterales bacterium]|nr:1-acyl-sn-glycerol-3-phosphate acyltransferase [Desulfobacterales bacterium]
MKQRLIAAGWFTFVSLTSVLFFLIALLIWIATWPLDRRQVVLQQFTCFWAALYTWIVPAWRIRIDGREHLPRKTPHVVVSNHQSLLDILVLFNLFFHFKFVSKIEIFKVPLIGWNMYLNKYVRLTRGDKKSVAKMLEDCEKALEQGSSVLIFPEGTRSPDGQIKAFKPGAFILALKMKAPILPIVISGTNAALPKYSINFHGRTDIHMRVLEPIAYESFAHLTVEETADMVRGVMTRAHDEIKTKTSEISG